MHRSSARGERWGAVELFSESRKLQFNGIRRISDELRSVVAKRLTRATFCVDEQ